MSPGADRFADRFVVSDQTYLLSHSVGLPVRGSRDIAGAYFDTWEHDTADAWPRWLDGIDGFRAALAALLGTRARSICPQGNVSSGLSKVLDSLRHNFDRPTVLISEDAFPSLGFVCERSDYDVRFIPNGVDLSDAAVWGGWLEGIAVAVITHVHSNTGECLPIPEIAAAARAAGAISVVDVAQSVGIIPIDLEEWHADVLVGSCVKWLSGGPGAGWLWIADGLLDRCVPTDVGWFSHEAPFEFDIHDYRDAPDALRFWGGTPTVLPFLIAAHSITTVDAIGVEAIRDHNLTLTDHLVAELGDRVTSPHRRVRRSGTAIIRAGAAAVDQLARHGIAVDHRAEGIRVSPHVYTTEHAIDRLATLLTKT